LAAISKLHHCKFVLQEVTWMELSSDFRIFKGDLRFVGLLDILCIRKSVPNLGH
jgi:hypothetical protein